jgi:hypothetical protein
VNQNSPLPSPSSLPSSSSSSSSLSSSHHRAMRRYDSLSPPALPATPTSTHVTLMPGVGAAAGEEVDLDERIRAWEQQLCSCRTKQLFQPQRRTTRRA